jgi:hypothetical protein
MAAPIEFKHLFTLEEAQVKLQEIIPKLEEMIELKTMLDRKGYDVYRHQYFGGMGPNGQKAFPVEMEKMVAIVAKLANDGIEVKDLNKGLIDFPHRRKNGEIVFLCYVHGESEILAWHTIEGGFQGRRSLDLL